MKLETRIFKLIQRWQAEAERLAREAKSGPGSGYRAHRELERQALLERIEELRQALGDGK